MAALAEFPGGGREDSPRLIEAARREKATGLPRGAARQLFRHVVELLTPPEPEEPDEEVAAGDEPDEDEEVARTRTGFVACGVTSPRCTGCTPWARAAGRDGAGRARRATAAASSRRTSRRRPATRSICMSS